MVKKLIEKIKHLMGGIAGFIDKSKETSEEVFSNMTNLLKNKRSIII